VLAVTSDRIGYYPDQQVWSEMGPAVGRPRTFVGYYRDGLPSPADLQVAEPLRGRAVKCRDGREWISPLAREFSNGAYHRCLPGRAKRVGGQWVAGEVEERYAELWSIATDFFDHMFGSQASEDATLRFNFAGALDAAVRVLSFNYRLGPDEAGLLGLFDDQLLVAADVLKATIDFDTFWAWQKKNLDRVTAGGWNTSAGEEASPATTPQRSPTSGRSTRSRK